MDKRSIAKRKVDHPDFEYCTTGFMSFEKSAPIVFVFRRQMFKTPTPKQVAEYEKNKAIVEAHGGRMLCRLDESAGKNKAYTYRDVEAMKRACRKHTDLEILHHWNGVGVYSCSVGARPRRKPPIRMKR